jgi:hypothetical protein
MALIHHVIISLSLFQATVFLSPISIAPRSEEVHRRFLLSLPPAARLCGNEDAAPLSSFPCFLPAFRFRPVLAYRRREKEPDGFPSGSALPI